MYIPNGDPGYPDESDFELQGVNAIWYQYDEETDDETEVKPTTEREVALDEYLNDLDLDEWNEPEPDYDD